MLFFLLEKTTFVFISVESLDLDQNEAAEPTFTYTIQAQDNSDVIKHSTTIDVILNVRRVNEFAPVITTVGDSLTVDENLPIGTVLKKVCLLELDRFHHGKIFFIIVLSRFYTCFMYAKEDSNRARICLVPRTEFGTITFDDNIKNFSDCRKYSFMNRCTAIFNLVTV